MSDNYFTSFDDSDEIISKYLYRVFVGFSTVNEAVHLMTRMESMIRLLLLFKSFQEFKIYKY